jgi:hypothetical protein
MKMILSRRNFMRNASAVLGSGLLATVLEGSNKAYAFQKDKPNGPLDTLLYRNFYPDDTEFADHLFSICVLEGQKGTLNFNPETKPFDRSYTIFVPSEDGKMLEEKIIPPCTKDDSGYLTGKSTAVFVFSEGSQRHNIEISSTFGNDIYTIDINTSGKYTDEETSKQYGLTKSLSIVASERRIPPTPEEEAYADRFLVYFYDKLEYKLQSIELADTLSDGGKSWTSRRITMTPMRGYANAADAVREIQVPCINMKNTEFDSDGKIVEDLSSIQKGDLSPIYTLIMKKVQQYDPQK